MAMLTVPAQGQTIGISTKFGDVSDTELDMTVYPPDTSAAVVILYRNKEVDLSFSDSFGLKRTETFTERVRIMKESGKDYPDYKITYITSCDPREMVSKIKVWTTNRENGKKTVYKLSKKMIYDEKVDENHHCVSFSAENVRVGSVVDVTFTLESPYVADIGTVFIQTYYPINYSEATVSYANYFTFNRKERGYLRCYKDSRVENATMLFSGGLTLPYEMVIDHYWGYDLPAMKVSRYCYCPDLYRQGYEYDLRRFYLPGQFTREFSTTWGHVDEKLRTDGIVKEFHARSRFGNEVAAILAETEDENERIVKIRNLVVSKVRWNEKTGIRPKSADAFKSQEGNAASINALVASALNEAGYVVEPVFILTRDDGMILDFHVSVDAYNAVLLQVVAPSGKIYYMDAARDSGYLNVLPPTYNVSKARVVPLNAGGSWVDISKLTRNQTGRAVTMNVSADGKINGKDIIQGSNSCAARMKNSIKHYGNDEKFIQAIENEDGITIDEFSKEGDDKWSPTARIEYTWTGRAKTAGDYIYVKPFVTKFQDESDFRESERMVPIDFPFAETINYTAVITIPEGYVVESMPQQTVIPCKPLGGRALLQCLYDGAETVSLTFRLSREAVVVPETEYQAVRDFWDMLIGLYNSTIVLKKA